MKIGTRLAIGFGAVFALMIGLTTLATGRVSSIDRMLTTISDVNGVKQRHAINFRGSVHDRSIAARDIVLAPDDAALQAELAKVATLSAAYAKSAGPMDAIFAQAGDVKPEERAALAAIKENENRTVALLDRIIALRKAGDIAGATTVLQAQAAPAFLGWLASINVMIDLEEKMSQEQAAGARSVAGSFLVFMVVLCAAAIAVGMFAAWRISRALLKELGGEPAYAVGIVGSIAAGNLAVAIDTRPGDTTSLLHAMRVMRDSLVDIIAQVRSGSQTIAQASAEIAAGNLDLSGRTEQQAGTLEETAASMEQLTSAVKQNSEHARQANQMALSASEVAVKGGAIVERVVDTMASINDSSKKIVDIIGVIDGIAFQTNILALNAAVEAARAGEQGRGFAVVASEVRSLAQRSATAAKEIKTLIGDSVDKVEAGAKLVDDAGETMQEIVSSVRRVTDIMSEISAASHEQTAGIEQVNQAIGTMDAVTQQNAALVEQAAAAADALEHQAGHLAGIVSVFRIDGGAQAALPVPKQQVFAKAPARIALPASRRPAVPPAAKASAAKAPVKQKALASNEEWEEF
ncbi:methyl-accepting chemotaxis protein [Pseudoduganella lurida]|uniref:Methyl-accepting chemotaxis protein n=2 Tax=Pseudoduganella lurida TaxID=1036180 RepID=A0A562RG56_9BURK|nr:methyl-accepting chemotaxis protein [Pseudoduganella lurida]